MTAGAMIVADGTTSQGELTRPLEKLGSVSVAQRMVDTFRHAGVDRIVLVSQQENRQALEKNIARTGAISVQEVARAARAAIIDDELQDQATSIRALRRVLAKRPTL